MNRQAAAAELLRRHRCRTSLHSYALNIDIPMAPNPASYPDEDLLGPAHTLMPKHHAVMLSAIERCMNTPFGRLMIFAPPGSAKSSLVQMALTQQMGKHPRSRYILTSYSSDLAELQSSRCQKIVQQENYRTIFEDVQIDKKALSLWSMTNGSELLAAGIRGGITGNRANGIIIDDPVAGQQEADSPADRKAILNAYNSDVKTRFLPGAWLIIIMTRWNEADLAGSILPYDPKGVGGWKGESGFIKCQDGMTWEVLNLPAKCERADDPLGREFGEYMWPEWFSAEHWAMFEGDGSPEGCRTWSSLFQQRPTPQGSGKFNREHFQWYSPGEVPKHLNKAGASDLCGDGTGDPYEHSVWGMDSDGNLYLLEGHGAQKGSDVYVPKMLEMARRHKVVTWFHEAGPIYSTIRPTMIRAMNEGKTYLDLRKLPSVACKLTRAEGLLARCGAGKVFLPKGDPWAEQMVEQLIALPAGRYDDKADCATLIARAVDQFHNSRIEVPIKREIIRPFTAAWIESGDQKPQGIRYR